ncbi:uncharacterized protein LOC135210240 [Macrobrachium nipponense]|uniref:uncharacterized protein LOC135210240 n=1 Tax=Macrobrachium nipponense TaxID=159736 RepID=UPI0030C8337E
MASTLMMGFKPLECGTCCNPFSKYYCPRILPCSHTFCSRCIDHVISNQKKCCPVCKEPFLAKSAAEVTINRNLLDVAEQLSSTQENDIQRQHQFLKSDTKREIYVVKTFRGKQKFAPVRICDVKQQICVDFLQEGELPQKSCILKLDSLIKVSSRRSFLELAYGNTYIGRISFKILDDGNKPLNFMHMFSADMGPSYFNSHILEVRQKGTAGENVRFGEYNLPEGKSCQAVLSGVNWKREGRRDIYKERLWKAGQVRGDMTFKCASLFWIVTKDGDVPKDKGFNDCFGIVEDGLEILKEVILRYPDIQNVRISNCGLLFAM